MEEQGTWKGHSFTLMVFVGIVFLCSIFFVLGMLVGRGQGQRAAEAAAVNTAAKEAAAEARNRAESEKTDLAYQVVESSKPSKPSKPAPALLPEPVKASPPAVVAPPKPAPKAAAPKTVAPTAPAPAPSKMLYLQVASFEKSSAANQEVDQLRKLGFPAIIESGEGANKRYRVQVGPYSNTTDVDTAKRKLESKGYKPIRK